MKSRHSRAVRARPVARAPLVDDARSRDAHFAPRGARTTTVMTLATAALASSSTTVAARATTAAPRRGSRGVARARVAVRARAASDDTSSNAATTATATTTTTTTTTTATTRAAPPARTTTTTDAGAEAAEDILDAFFVGKALAETLLERAGGALAVRSVFFFHSDPAPTPSARAPSAFYTCYNAFRR